MKTKLKILCILLSTMLILIPLAPCVSAADASPEDTAVSETAGEESNPEAPENEPGLLEQIKALLALLNPSNWINLLIYALADLLCSAIESIVNAINVTFNNDFFATQYVNEFLDFFYFLAWIILSVGFIKGIITELERSYHGEASLLQDLFKNFMAASGVIIFARHGVLWANQMTIMLINDLTDVTLGGIWTPTMGIGASSLDFSAVLWFAIVLIIITVISIKTIWMAFKRCGILLLQIVTGYLYSFDLASGNRSVLGEWIRDIVSGCVTFALQIIFYQIGMRYCSDGLLVLSGIEGLYNSEVIVGLIFLATAGSIPTIMRRWGYANQQGQGHVAQLVNLAAGAARLLV